MFNLYKCIPHHLCVADFFCNQRSHELPPKFYFPLGSSSASSAASMPARYVENISHLSQKHEVQNLPITHFRDKFTLFPIHFPGIIRIDVRAQFIAPWDASILHNDVVEYNYSRDYL